MSRLGSARTIFAQAICNSVQSTEGSELVPSEPIGEKRLAQMERPKWGEGEQHASRANLVLSASSDCYRCVRMLPYLFVNLASKPIFSL